MTKWQIIPINLILLAIWTWILISFVTIYKTEVYFGDTNPYLNATVWILYFLALLYTHFFITRNIILNLVITTILFRGAYYLGYYITEEIINYLEKMDHGKTPLGWSFKYRFLEIPFLNVLVLIFLELMQKVVPERWRQY